ncbi:Bgt-50081 [Blumeria graminis f. sp. tritici]|uniref:Bgt-50081 n=1 Tax=Blumeria graminis f. sp. tritici TaxID=62690 RepID=A0A9X9MPC1_BLUGR|nr:Bgt-50081 [Blumeria graminis f. sp. tritici]
MILFMTRPETAQYSTTP